MAPRFNHHLLKGFMADGIAAFIRRGIPSFPCPTAQKINTYGLNPKAYSGLIVHGKTGIAKKTSPILYAIARKWYAQEALPLRCIYRAGGREKIQDSGPSPKTRLIMMEDAICGLISQPFSKPVYRWLESVMCETFMGQSFFKARYKQFTGYMQEGKWYAMWDWGGFDARVNNVVLDAALTLFRSFFKEDAHDRFDACAHNFVHKLVAYGGRIFGMSTAVPSGHSWTSLVDTLCNYLMTRSLLLAMYGEKNIEEFKISVCGDDVYVGCKKDLPIPKEEELNALALVMYRGIIKPGSYGVSLSFDGPDAQSMAFLAHGFKNGKPVRHAPEIVDSLLCPTQWPRYAGERLDVAVAFMIDTPWRLDEWNWTEEWLRRSYDLCGHPSEEYEEWRASVIRDAFSLSEDWDTEVPMAVVPENLRIMAMRTVVPEGVEEATTPFTMKDWIDEYW
jgi:hypothetical protein